jgi:hypothetical protein
MDELEICPHCGKRGIFDSPRRYYARGWPAVCRECGGLSYDRRGCLFELLIKIGGLVFALCFLAELWQLIGVILAVVIAAAILMRRSQPSEKFVTRFRPITPEKSRMSRRVSLSMALAAFVGAILLAWVMASSPPEKPSPPLRIKWKWPGRRSSTYPSPIPVETVIAIAAVP